MVNYTVFKGSKEGKIIQATTSRGVKADEVLVKVTHSGLCGSDQLYRHAGIALGHEGAGIVAEIGSAVTTLAKGDSVGWGYIHHACLDCKQCLTGHENRCPDVGVYGMTNLDQGSFASHSIWRADFLFKIPLSIPRELAAPLMCGGATVYNALSSFNIKPADRVGIIGVGGLGHLGIQFAAKMGCDVVVFSTTDSKKHEAFTLGASEFYDTKDKTEIEVGDKLDHLIVTTSSQPDWNIFLPTLAPGATIFPLTISLGELKIPYMPLLSGQLRIQGSIVAARQVQREMLAFAARHSIVPIIEKFDMDVNGITAAMQRLDEGKMRYRGVFVAKD